MFPKILKNNFDEKPSYKWQDEKIINYYKKKAREICAILEKEEKKNMQTLGDYAIKSVNDIMERTKKRPQTNSYKSRYMKENYKPENSETNHRNDNNKIFRNTCYNKHNKTKEEPESVLSMLFPYVKEEHFKMDTFKTGADLIEEKKYKPNLIIIRLNQERRLKSNFKKKFQKYDKELNTYADTPSIRCSSQYATEDQIYRRQFIESKKKWVSKEDFHRVFGKKTESDRIKQLKLNYQVEPDVYVEPFQRDKFRKTDKRKWISKKDFIV